MDDDDDALRPAELVSQGGTWRGLLFDNPNIGLPPGLTWTFEFVFGDVERDYGASPVSFTVDWVPLPGAGWSAMAGGEASADVFAEPIETSVYFFEHHRYDAVRLRVLEQDGTRLRVAAEAHGDVDAMGVPTWSVDEWLDFGGIIVQLTGVDTPEDAAARLADHTDTTGLTGARTAHNFTFRPPATG